jgi:hypothetical protein
MSKGMKPMPMPTRYDAPTTLTIVALIGRGMQRIEAARAAGVSRTTFCHWIRRGRMGDPKFEPFAYAVEQAEAGHRFGVSLLEIAGGMNRRFRL